MPSDLYDLAYRDQPEEHAFQVDRVSGTIPPGLQGTLLRSGPGRMRLGAASLNFFDGHALIAGLTFAEGRATFRSRFVRTPLYERETAADAILQRRVFTNHPSRWSNLFALSLGNSAMHDVYAWGEGDALRIVAGNDPGHFALDARTLATLGPERFGGAVKQGEEASPMPYPDPTTGRLVGWIKTPGGLSPDKLRFVEVDGAWNVVKQTPAYALGASPVLVHDQRATARWYVATEAALRLSPAKALWGAGTVYDALATPAGQTATLLLAPREGDGPLVRIPLPAPLEVAFHVINAFDDGEAVVVDLVTYSGRIRFDLAFSGEEVRRRGLAPGPSPLPTPTRFRVDPRSGTILESAPLGAVAGEAPEVADAVMGRPYRFAWFPTPAVDEGRLDPGAYPTYDAICRLEVATGETRIWRSGGLVSPIAFVGRPGATDEDDGWALAWVLRRDGASVHVFDARAPQDGPVAVCDLGVHLPGISHVRWAPNVRLDG